MRGDEVARRGRVLGTILYVLAVLVVLAAGVGAAAYMFHMRPKAQRRRPPKRAMLVTVAEVQRSTEKVVIEAMGTVRPARQIELRPQVGGKLVEVSAECVPGGLLRKGDLIARVEAADYELAVAQQEADLGRLAATADQQRAQVAVRESEVAQSESLLAQRTSDLEARRADVAKTEAAWKLELGQQAVARREYELLGKKLSGLDLELVLREPQLATAQANLDAAKAALRSAEAAKRFAEAARDGARAMKEAAEAAARAAEATVAAAKATLERARLDLARTELRAPFNATILAENVDPGAIVSPQTTVATLAGTDEFWVQVSIPVDELRWVRIPGSRARVYDEAAWGEGVWREGRVVRLLSALEPQGRMARLLVAVADPLGLENPSANLPKLLIGSYVRVEIEGTELPGVIPLPREHLHEGEKVWVMRDGKLEVRTVKVAFKSRHTALVAEGLEPGDLVVTTPLSAPVDGMPLRVASGGEAVAEAPTEPGGLSQ